MFSILGSILSVAVVVAKVAADVLPIILKRVGQGESGDIAAVQTGLVKWVPDDRKPVVYCSNATTKTLALTYMRETPVGTSYAVESEALELRPSNAIDATKDLQTYSDNGRFTATYIDATDEVEDAGPDTKFRKLISTIPFLATMSYLAFGGKIKFERGKGDKSDYWQIGSDSRLKGVSLKYETSDGKKIDFKVDLKEPNGDAPSGDLANTYKIDMGEYGTSTGVLSNFETTVIAEEAEFNAFLSDRETFAITDLSPAVQAALAD